MEFRSLRAFVEVIRQGGFSQAAKTTFITQSAVSKAVKQLEQELGTPLLERAGYKIVPTAAGEVVYRRGVKLLADRDDLLTELDDISSLKQGVLRLGLAPVASGPLFAPLFAIYRKRYPGIEIKLFEHGSAELEDGLREGRLDFAGVLMPSSPAFEWEPIRREPLVAMLSATNPLSGRQAVSLTDLKDTPFILFDHGFALHRIILDACHLAGFEPNIVACSSQTDFMIELVDADLGVTFMPRIIAANTHKPGVCRIPLEEPTCDWLMTMAWRRGGYLSVAANAWLDLVREFGNLASDPEFRNFV